MKFLMAVVGASLVFSSTFSAQAKTAVKTETESPLKAEALIEFANNSSSISDLLESYQTIGLIDESARADILTFLKEQKVDINKHPANMQLIKGLYTTDGRTGFKYTPGVGFQTSQGRIINVDKAQTVSQIYRMLFQAMSEDVKFSWFQQFLTEAYAGDRPSRDAVALEALTIFPSVVAGWATNHLEARIALIIAYPVNIRNLWNAFVHKGEVECQGSKYVLITGYSPHRTTLPENQRVQLCENLRKQGKLLYYGTKASCEYNEWAGEYMNNALDTDQDRWVVPEKDLAEIFKPSSAPACNAPRNEANVKKVKEAMKNNFAKLLKAKAPSTPTHNQGRGATGTGVN
jgi:hypothetical protein